MNDDTAAGECAFSVFRLGCIYSAPEDVDLSDPERFRSVIHEEPGEPVDPVSFAFLFLVLIIQANSVL